MRHLEISLKSPEKSIPKPEKPKYLARTAVLKAELAKEKTKLKTLYSDLGSLYFTLHKDAPEDPLAQTCDTIKDIIKNIEIKESELEALNQDYDPDASDAGFTSARKRKSLLTATVQNKNSNSFKAQRAVISLCAFIC